MDRAMEFVTMNGQPYKDEVATEPSKDFIEIEPVTGVMTRMRRSYTMVYSIHCFDTQTNECQSYSQMPFPSLDMFKNKQFPVFNVTEELTINHEQFLNLVSYITDAHLRIWSWSFYLSIISFICLFLAGCFQCIYLMNEPMKQKKFDPRLEKLKEVE